MDNSMVRTEDVIWRRIGDETVAIKDDGLSVHVLNKTASIIWETLADTCDLDKIAGKLCERFEISFDEARGDVEKTISKLEQIGLLKRCEGCSRQ